MYVHEFKSGFLDLGRTKKWISTCGYKKATTTQSDPGLLLQ